MFLDSVWSLFVKESSFWAYIDPGTGVTLTTFSGVVLALLSGALGVLLYFFKRLFRFFKRHGPKIAGVVFLFLLLIGLGGVFMTTDQYSMDHRIVILGLDALDPDVIKEMEEQGRLPAFRRLQDEGAFRRLKTTQPPQSPVAWAAFATGQNPGKNGVFDFIRRDPESLRIELALHTAGQKKLTPVVRSSRFWQILSRKGIPVEILFCPLTFPPDKVRGHLLSGMGVPDILGTEGTFSFYSSRPDVEQSGNGGQVIRLRRGEKGVAHFLGPRVQQGRGPAAPLKVPFHYEKLDGERIRLTYGRQSLVLKKGEWTDWQRIVFPLGWFQKIHGIARFYLVSVEPDLELYVSPINLDPEKPYWPLSYPAGFSRDVARQYGLFATQGMPFDTWALNEGRLDEKAFLQQAQDVFAFRKKLTLDRLHQFDQGVFFAYFESPDIIQHMFWRFRDPDHPLYDPQAPEEYRTQIEAWYEKMDALVAEVRSHLSEKDVLIVLSDHGFGSFRRAVHLNTWLREKGYLTLKDPAARSGGPLLQDVDWSRTQAYAVGFGAIYINQRGREKNGLVAPGQEKEALKKRLIQDLEAWTDPQTGGRIVHRAFAREDVLWGPYAEEGPDIVVGYADGYRASWQTALGEAPFQPLEDNARKWSGSHLFDADLVDGVLFSNQPIEKTSPAILDLAPSLLALSGFSAEEIAAYDFDGEPLWPAPKR